LAKLHNKKKVSFLISGGGSNLLKILKNNYICRDFDVVTIISNNKISTNIKSCVNKFYKNVLVMELKTKLQKKNFFDTNTIFSVGYMKVIEKSIIENFDVINLHPSILPAYKGLMTQKRMLINNEKNYGFTLHKVSNALDEGETVSNKIKKINTKDESELLKKHKNLEHGFVYKQFVDYLLG
jgi:phosphoribosylglycinamide formyltransferase-1